MANIEEINDNNFNQMITRSNNPIVVDFGATWCGPCRKLAPILEQLQNEFPNVKFYKIDADKNTKSAKEYGVLSLPTVLIFKDGEVQETLAGMMPKSAISGSLKKVLQ